MTTSDKARCACGREGTLRSLQKHAAQCPAYSEMYEANPNDIRLDMRRAHELYYTDEAEEQRAVEKDEKRDEWLTGLRARNAAALEMAKERFKGGTKFTSQAGRDFPVPTPEKGLLKVPAHLEGTARAAAMDPDAMLEEGA